MRYLAIIFCFIFLAFPLFATDLIAGDSLKEKLSEIIPKHVDELIADGKVFYMNYDGKTEGKKVVFNSRLLSRIEEKLSLKAPLFTLEVLYFVKKSTKAKGTDLSKILRSISSLKGLKYYSPSRKKYRFLYKDSFVVEKKETKNGRFDYVRAEDPVNVGMDGLSILVSQQDLTFGKNIYQYDYFQDNYGMALMISNINPLYYSLFKAINENELSSYIIFHDVGDYLLIYACTKANFAKLFGLEKKIKNSFSSRLDALCNWVISKYND
ncbi:MAG: DUF6675 family protein [Treponema sp.]